MYIFDFVKRLFRLSNIPVIIYLVLNVLFIGLVMSLMFTIDYGTALLYGLGIYLVSLVVALSPIGEWILRFQTGCKKIKDQNIKNYLEPLFQEVYAKAKAEDPTIPNNVRLFLNDDASPNAFATGRKTVCVTRGLLVLPPEEIKATLAHEFGHLAHKDTDLILVVTVGNLIFNLLVTIIKIVLTVFEWILLFIAALAGGRESWLGIMFVKLCSFLAFLFVNGLMWIWTTVGNLLVMASSRGNEYEADAFSFTLGYGNALCSMLNRIAGGAKPQGLFATLASSHPATDKRIDKIRELQLQQQQQQQLNYNPA